MKLLFLLLISFSVSAQVVKYPAYTAYYNPKTLIPDSVVWVETPHVKVCGREAGFHATNGRPNLERDYRYRGYDIGHNADAADMNGNKIDEYNSFDFVNTYPQLPNCNRKTWLALENYTRTIKVPVRVKVSWVGVKGYLGIDKITIPLMCVKELQYSGRVERYVIPNNDTCVRHLFSYYLEK
jgi:DNA/RNA endonuclease G (NUC1)